MSDAHTQPRREGNTPLIPNHGQAPGRTGNADLNAINVAQEDFDEYGAELRQDARVWKAYVKEADKFDSEQVDGWNRSLDVTLIFAALFTAICTAFVIESSKSLKEDPAETAARRLDQITSILFVVANVSDRSQLNPNITSPISPMPFAPRPVDVCVNVLWFFSLILSAAVSLFAMLAKEWCYLFMSGRIGDPWSQTKRRQQRWEGIEKWKMEQVIIILPSFVHLSFLSFAIGLCIYLGDLNGHVAILAAIVTFGSMFIYVASTLLPLVQLSDTICPYSTSISRFVLRFREDTKGAKQGVEKPNRIAVGALAWLIKSSEDPKSTDVALQAIAGAEPNDADRQLLKDVRADILISRRLMGLNPRSANHEKLLDLYVRAHSFFRTSASVQLVTRPISTHEKGSVKPNEEGRVGSKGGYQKGLNSEPQKKIRDLRDIINQEIAAYMTSSSDAFLSTPDNILALRIGITAASHCLQPLQHGTQYRTKELFDSAIELLENYRNRTARLNDREIQYLMIGTAMLLSSLLIDCLPPAGARYVMRLLRIAGRADLEEQQLLLKYLGLPLVVYALSRHDYYGWTRPPPLSPISRAERAIEVITYYTTNTSELGKASSVMVNLALVELLSDPETYRLEDEDIGIISKAFDPISMVNADINQTQIHTLYTKSFSDELFRTTQSMEETPLGRYRDAVVAACLTALNQAKTGRLTSGTPLGHAYIFAIECALNLPLLSPAQDGENIMLNVMQKFHDYLNQEQELIPDLPQLLSRREIFAKLKRTAEKYVADDDMEAVVKLFATGQAWFLMEFAIKSGATHYEDWRQCMRSFVWNICTCCSPKLTASEFEEYRDALAEQYRVMWDTLPRQSHPYLVTLYNALSSAGKPSKLPSTNKQLPPGPSLQLPYTPPSTPQHEHKEPITGNTSNPNPSTDWFNPTFRL